VNAPFKRLIADTPQPSGGALLQTITESDRQDRKPGGATGLPGAYQGRPEEPTEIRTPNDG